MRGPKLRLEGSWISNAGYHDHGLMDLALDGKEGSCGIRYAVPLCGEVALANYITEVVSLADYLLHVQIEVLYLRLKLTPDT